jgi:hypothetical protein
MSNNTSQHILSTAANLLGFCLFVITSLHFNSKAENSIIDELTSIVALLLATSAVFSFTSIRSQTLKLKVNLETIADYLFIISLIGVVLIILFITFKFVD